MFFSYQSRMKRGKSLRKAGSRHCDVCLQPVFSSSFWNIFPMNWPVFCRSLFLPCALTRICEAETRTESSFVYDSVKRTMWHWSPRLLSMPFASFQGGALNVKPWKFSHFRQTEPGRVWSLQHRSALSTINVPGDAKLRRNLRSFSEVCYKNCSISSLSFFLVQSS